VPERSPLQHGHAADRQAAVAARSGRTFDKYTEIPFAPLPSGCPHPQEYMLACLHLMMDGEAEPGTHVLVVEEAVMLRKGRP